jgi:hypothetical protein
MQLIKKTAFAIKTLTLHLSVRWNKMLLAIDDWLIVRRVAAIKSAERRAAKTIERSGRRLVKLRLAQAHAMADSSLAAAVPARRRPPTTCAIRVIGPSSL